MARSPSERAQLCLDFMAESRTHWIFNPELWQLLKIKRIILGSQLPWQGARGLAIYSVGHLWVSSDTAKFRGTSPYSAPGGKSDMSPVGVLVHELGHFLDMAVSRAGSAQERKEFRQNKQKLFISDRKHAVTSYAKTCVEEDFAESHRLFCLNPRLLRDLSPERFALVQGCYATLLGHGENPRSVFRLTAADRREAISQIQVRT